MIRLALAVVLGLAGTGSAAAQTVGDMAENPALGVPSAVAPPVGRVDADGDRVVTEAEQEDYMVRFFAAADNEGKGYLIEPDYQAVIGPSALAYPAPSHARFTLMDANADGRVTLDEFRRHGDEAFDAARRESSTAAAPMSTSPLYVRPPTSEAAIPYGVPVAVDEFSG